MTSMHEIILVGRVIELLNHYHSWCGETHIQKSSYVAKMTKGVPFESHFILYKHGPYSFDLNSVINHMRSQNLLTVTPQGSYGSSYRLNQGLWAAVCRASKYQNELVENALEFVCRQFARKKVSELERVATAVYVSYNFSDLNKSMRVVKLNELKPHIGLPEAEIAFSEAEVFLQAAA